MTWKGSWLWVKYGFMEYFSETTACAMTAIYTNSVAMLIAAWVRQASIPPLYLGFNLALTNWATTSKHSTALFSCFVFFSYYSGNSLSLWVHRYSAFWKQFSVTVSKREEFSQLRDIFVVCISWQNLTDYLSQVCNPLDVPAVALVLSVYQ